MEAIYVSITGLMNKIICLLYTCGIYTHTEEYNSTIKKNKIIPRNHDTKWSKRHRKINIMWYHFYVKRLTDIESEFMITEVEWGGEGIN